jgi:hypothetical protein
MTEPRYFAREMADKPGVWEVIDSLNQSRTPDGVLIPDGMVYAVATDDAEADARAFAADANRDGADYSELMQVARKVIDKWDEMGCCFDDECESRDLGYLLEDLATEMRHHD